MKRIYLGITIVIIAILPILSWSSTQVQNFERGIFKLGDQQFPFINISDSIDTHLELFHTLEAAIGYTQFNCQYPKTVVVDSAIIWENANGLVRVRLHSKAHNVYDVPGPIITHLCIRRGKILHTASTIEEIHQTIPDENIRNTFPQWKW